MIILGVILILVGYLLPISVPATIGWILVAIGLILLLVGAVHGPVAGRRYWF